MTLVLAVGLGLLIGLALGALGGGGPILTVPALVYLLGEPPHAAATASLTIVGATALSGTLTHGRGGRPAAAAVRLRRLDAARGRRDAPPLRPRRCGRARAQRGRRGRAEDGD